MPFRHSRSAPGLSHRSTANNRGDDRGNTPSHKGDSPYRSPGPYPSRQLIPRGDDQSPERYDSSPSDVAYRTAIGDVVIDTRDRRNFPSRQRLQAASTRTLHDIENHLSQAPWWDQHAIADRELINYYVDENGFLPDGLPGSIVDSFDFTRRCLVPQSDLRARGGGGKAWFRHIRYVYTRRARMPCGDPNPPVYGVDLYT